MTVFIGGNRDARPPKARKPRNGSEVRGRGEVGGGVGTLAHISLYRVSIYYRNEGSGWEVAAVEVLEAADRKRTGR